MKLSVDEEEHLLGVAVGRPACACPPAPSGSGWGGIRRGRWPCSRGRGGLRPPAGLLPMSSGSGPGPGRTGARRPSAFRWGWCSARSSRRRSPPRCRSSAAAVVVVVVAVVVEPVGRLGVRARARFRRDGLGARRRRRSAPPGSAPRGRPPRSGVPSSRAIVLAAAGSLAPVHRRAQSAATITTGWPEPPGQRPTDEGRSAAAEDPQPGRALAHDRDPRAGPGGDPVRGQKPQTGPGQLGRRLRQRAADHRDPDQPAGGDRDRPPGGAALAPQTDKNGS